MNSIPLSVLEGGVGTTEEVLGLLQGTAGETTRIGAEYMPEVLTPTSILLSDQSDVDLDNGALALDENGRVIVGTTSGNEEVGLKSRFRIRNAIHVPAGSVTGGLTRQQLGVFKLRADEWTNNQRILVTGVVSGLASSTYAGYLTARIGFRPTGAALAGFVSTSTPFGVDGTQFVCYLQAFAKITSNGTNLGIDEDTTNVSPIMATLVRYDATAANIVGFLQSNAVITATNATTPNVATDVEVYISLPQDAAFTGIMKFQADLELVLL